MKSNRTKKREIIRITATAMIIIQCSLIPISAQPGPPLDQNKYRPDLTLFFTDIDGDSCHDPGEPFSDEAPGLQNRDNSCWMASASNMLNYEGLGNHYGQPSPGTPGWLGNGGAPSLSVTPWGDVYPCQGGGAYKTFDDGGWQHWAINHAGHSCVDPIFTDIEFHGGSWSVDPIEWSQAMLSTNCPVGVTWWWGSAKAGHVPGCVDVTRGWAYHAITIWEINEVDESSGAVMITDSDDNIDGARWCDYSYSGYTWTMVETAYEEEMIVTINYSVATESLEVPALTDSSLIALCVMLLACGVHAAVSRRTARNFGA
jgi:hypothetical protein